jgi:hypothetical protein
VAGSSQHDCLPLTFEYHSFTNIKIRGISDCVLKRVPDSAAGEASEAAP